MREIWIFLIDHLPFLTSVLDVIKKYFDIKKSIYDIKTQKKKGDETNVIVVFENVNIFQSNTTMNYNTTSTDNRK